MKIKVNAMVILFVSLVIVMLGFGIAIPLMPYYIAHFGASGSALGFMITIYSIMQFIFAPVWGRLSDRIGRKPVLLIGILGFAIAFLMQGIAQNLWQFILARALAGVLSSAALPTVMAYVADTTTLENRSRGMGVMGAAMGMGMIFGPMVGGVLTQVAIVFPGGIENLMQKTMDPSNNSLINLSFPYLCSGVLALVTYVILQLFLPESMPAEARQSVQTRQSSNLLHSLTGALRGPLAFLFVMSFLVAFALANMEGVLGLYGKDRFNMGPSEMGLMMGGIGILSVLMQGLLIGPLSRRLGEERVLQVSLVISAVGFSWTALAPTKWMMMLSALFFTIGNALLNPTVNALFSKRATEGQGAALGSAQSFQSLGRAAGPLWAGFVYDFYPAMPFWSGAFIQLVGFAASLPLLKPVPEGEKVQEASTSA